MAKDKDAQSPQEQQLTEQLRALQREDEMLQNILAINIWAIAKTMDEFQPGFWSAFMKNRKQALKRFLDTTSRTESSDVPRPPFLR